jgi:hypothetical protein
VAATDPDSGAFGTQRYHFLNGTTASQTSSDGRYTIDVATGAIRTAVAIDRETMSAPATYTVIARDNAGGNPHHQVQTSVTVTVNDLNEANAIPGSYGFAVNENVVVGTAVGTVAATDLDAASAVTGQQRYYFLNGSTASATSSDGRYAIDTTTGAIRTAAPSTGRPCPRRSAIR